MPLGSTAIEAGVHERTFRLPSGAAGTFNQPLVFFSSQPSVEAAGADAASENADSPPKKQVAATIKFTVGDVALPAWQLQPTASAYVINLQTIRKNPQFDKGNLALKVELVSLAPSVGILAMGMPDPRLLGDAVDGPLTDLAAATKNPEVIEYFSALQLEASSRLAEARATYEKLAKSRNEPLARFARRGLRLLAYQTRPHKLSGNFNEHHRWAMYLEQCGLIGPANTEFDECRVIYSDLPEVHYRTAEAAERLGGAASIVLGHMVRSASLCQVTDPTNWYALVVILGERPGKRLTNSELAEAKNQFLMMQGMVWAATKGMVRIMPTFLTVWDQNQWAYHFRGDGVLGPCDEIVRERGWFDSVFSVVPRLPDDTAPSIATVGGDQGPRGAAMSSLPQDANWMDYLQAFYEQYTWAARIGEVGVCFPDLADARHYGIPPVPHRGYALRAAFAGGFTEAMHRRVKCADIPAVGNYLRLWKVEGPFSVRGEQSASAKPGHHVMDPLSASALKTIRIESDSDFVDLAGLLPGTGWALAKATCWVYSPDEREVRMWLGQNDGAALWLNGRCIHEGRYYSAGQYEDKNLTDTVAMFARLQQGWNELRVVVESWPAPLDRGWGFSVRLCNWNNTPIAGLACANEIPSEDLAPPATLPKVGPHYAWKDVQSNYLERLPQLSSADLSSITAFKDLAATSGLQAAGGYFAVLSPSRAESASYRPMPSSWQSAKDYDVVLNNVMDWSREACAALRYQKNGKDHDLLFVKPESLENFLTLLAEPPSAQSLFNGASPFDRILGYLLITDGASKRPLIVVDTLLGDGKTWPRDEEDLMSPLPPVYVPNRGIKPHVTSAPAANP